ncbi:MAG: hypothetical protein ACTSSF_00010 [Candidatus Heimdallarchaeaceae archaeon]
MAFSDFIKSPEFLGLLLAGLGGASMANLPPSIGIPAAQSLGAGIGAGLAKYREAKDFKEKVRIISDAVKNKNISISEINAMLNEIPDEDRRKKIELLIKPYLEQKKLQVMDEMYKRYINGDISGAEQLGMLNGINLYDKEVQNYFATKHALGPAGITQNIFRQNIPQTPMVNINIPQTRQEFMRTPVTQAITPIVRSTRPLTSITGQPTQQPSIASMPPSGMERFPAKTSSYNVPSTGLGQGIASYLSRLSGPELLLASKSPAFHPLVDYLFKDILARERWVRERKGKELDWQIKMQTPKTEFRVINSEGYTITYLPTGDIVNVNKTKLSEDLGKIENIIAYNDKVYIIPQGRKAVSISDIKDKTLKRDYLMTALGFVDNEIKALLSKIGTAKLSASELRNLRNFAMRLNISDEDLDKLMKEAEAQGVNIGLPKTEEVKDPEEIIRYMNKLENTRQVILDNLSKLGMKKKEIERIKRLDAEKIPQGIEITEKTSTQTLSDEEVLKRYPDAKKAPDGNWYVKRNGKWYRIE